MAQIEKNTAAAVDKAVRDRSPSFPFIPLPVAIDRLEKFESKFGRHPTPVDKTGFAWGMKEKSSQAYQTLAAMKSFGLIDYKGAGKSRVALLTNDGRNYLRAHQDSVKVEILKTCALRPRVIRSFWEQWGSDRPIDPICLDELILKFKFTDSAARTFLRVYDATVAFAGLSSDDKMDEFDDASDDSEQENVGADATTQGAEMNPPANNMGKPKQHEASPLPQTQNTKQENTTLTYGCAVLQWPEKMTEEDYEDFKDWIEIVLRKAKRSLVSKPSIQ